MCSRKHSVLSARFPHTFVLLFLLIALAAAATHFIPAGAYDRVVREGREVVDPGSYRPVPSRPAGLAEVLLAYPRGLVATAPIVVYIFLIGGAFGVLQATGAIEAALAALVRASGGRGPLALGILLFVFALGGGTIGLAEETLPLIPPLVLLARRLGYDETTGAAIALVGAGAGFSGAFLNPFTVGVGQAIAGLPLFSGMGYRLIVWTVITALAILYVELYARRVRAPVAAAAGDEATTVPTRATGPQGLVLALLVATLVLLGDGFSNILTPTQGYFMAALALAGVPWTRWARFIWPLQLAWLVAGLALLLIAHAIGWS